MSNDTYLRFCERCAGEVQDAGGFCLLGHPLRLDPLIPSVADIRDEVDRAFEEANADVDVLEVHGAPDELVSLMQQPPPPPARSPGLWDSLHDEEASAPGDPISAFAPPPRMDWGPDERGGLLSGPLRRRHRPAPA